MNLETAIIFGPEFIMKHCGRFPEKRTVVGRNPPWFWSAGAPLAFGGMSAAGGRPLPKDGASGHAPRDLS